MDKLSKVDSKTSMYQWIEDHAVEFWFATQL